MDLFLNAKINEAFSFYIALHDTSDSNDLQANPTLAAGDALHSGDGAATSNLATLPAVNPAGGRNVLVTLSAAEMNHANIMITMEDVAGDEWDAMYITIHTYATDTDDLVRSTTPANTADISSAGNIGIDWGNVANPTTTVGLTNTTVGIVTALTGHTVQTGDSFARLAAPAGASVSADIAAMKVDTAAILVDTNELQADWTNGGRLDLIIDAIVADTNELQGDWTNGGRLDTIIDSILADTGVLQTDWANGGRLDLILDLIAADTNELQADWTNTGRLDTLLDTLITNVAAILVDTGTAGVQIDLTQVYTEGQAARTVGGALEIMDAEGRNRIVNTGAGGARTLYRSNGTTILATRNITTNGQDLGA